MYLKIYVCFFRCLVLKVIVLLSLLGLFLERRLCESCGITEVLNCKLYPEASLISNQLFDYKDIRKMNNHSLSF